MVKPKRKSSSNSNGGAAKKPKIRSSWTKRPESEVVVVDLEDDDGDDCEDPEQEAERLGEGYWDIGGKRQKIGR